MVLFASYICELYMQYHYGDTHISWSPDEKSGKDQKKAKDP